MKKLSICFLTTILVFVLSLFFICINLNSIVSVDKKLYFENMESTYTNKEGESLKKISTFSTRILSRSLNRLNNIKVALSAINNFQIIPLVQYSFNNITGERREDRGYKKALVISEGEYVEGVGGGVCQVSTTFYNALLLADVDIIEVHSHTLKPSYVKGSFDAMVNFGVSDLKFINYNENVFTVKAYIEENNIVVDIYGKDSEFYIEQVSILKREIPFQYEIIVDTENKYIDYFKEDETEYILKTGKNGCVTAGYLKYYKDNVFVKQIKIREDIYLSRSGVKIQLNKT